MEPFEIMISESQERMAAIVEPASWAAVAAVCARWDVDATVIGEVTETGRLRAFHGGELVGDIPVETLTDDAPRYDVERQRPARLVEDGRRRGGSRRRRPTRRCGPCSAAPGTASRRWVTRQYDQLVGSGTVVRPGGDASVVRLTPSSRAIAVSLDGNGRRTWLDPRRGGMSAVCEAARNVACTGARPAAVTNCLNFGNPEHAEIGYELAEAIEGMAEACTALGLPVVSGNVSLYNEHDGRAIQPTPVVGVVGILDDAELAVRAAFRDERRRRPAGRRRRERARRLGLPEGDAGRDGRPDPRARPGGRAGAAQLPGRGGRAKAAAKRARRRRRRPGGGGGRVGDRRRRRRPRRGGRRISSARATAAS